MNVLRTNTHNNFLADISLKAVILILRSREFNFILNTGAGLCIFGAKLYEIILALFKELRLDKVHLRRTDKSGNEKVAGIEVKVIRGINLLNKTALHNNNAGTHCHSLGLVVGNVNKRSTQTLVKLRNFGTHLCTELSIQVGKRFVKQEYLRLTNYCTSQSNTLTLTTGQSLRLTL